jgi:hypothetical protein
MMHASSSKHKTDVDNKGSYKARATRSKTKNGKKRRETPLKARPCYFEDKVGFENFPTQN